MVGYKCICLNHFILKLINLLYLIGVCSCGLFREGFDDYLVAISTRHVTSLTLPGYGEMSSQWPTSQPHKHFYIDQTNEYYYWTDDGPNLFRTDFVSVNATSTHYTTQLVYHSTEGNSISGFTVDTSEGILFVSEFPNIVKLVVLRTGYPLSIHRDAINPTVIYLDIQEKLLYWREDVVSESGRHGHTIYSSWYDGTEKQVVYHQGNRAVGDYEFVKNGLSKTIYMCDFLSHSVTYLELGVSVERVERVERVTMTEVDMDRGSRSNSCTIAHHQRILYFTFQATNRKIYKIPIGSSRRYSTVLRNHEFDIQSLFIYTTENGISSACATNNGGCHDVCLPIEQLQIATCYCMGRETLLADNKTCTFDGGKLPGLLYSTSADQLCHTLLPLTAEQVIESQSLTECATTYLPEQTKLNLKALRLNFHPDKAVHTYRSVASFRVGSNEYSYIGPISFDSHIGDICVDWSVGNVYWTDTKGHQIWVSRYGGVFMDVLIRETESPSLIVIDTTKRQLYWVEHHLEETIQIRRAYLDGSQVEQFVELNATDARSLAIDYLEESLYFFSAQGLWRFPLYTNHSAHIISQLSGENLQNVNIFQTMLIGNYNTSLQFYDKFSMRQTGHMEVLGDTTQGHIDNVLPYYEPAIQNIYKRHYDCMYNNGGCEQLCLVSGHLESYRCACRYGMFLDEDQRSCVSRADVHTEMLIVSSSAHRTLFHIGSHGDPQIIPGISVNDRPVHAKYSAHTGYIYWMVNVAYYNFTGTRFSIIKKKPLYSVIENDIQVIYDGIQGNNSVASFEVLYTGGQDMVYYLDDSLNQIRLITSEGEFVKIISAGISEPGDLTINQDKGQIYLSSSNRLIVTNLDGSETMMLRRAEMMGLIFNKHNEEIVWCDPVRGDLLSYNISADTSYVLISGEEAVPGSSCDVTMSSDEIYWVSSHSRGIQSTSNSSSDDVQHTTQNIMYIDSIQYVNTNGTGEDDRCHGYNCTHVCIRLQHDIRCICPAGRSVQEERADPCVTATFRLTPPIEQEDWNGTEHDFNNGDVLTRDNKGHTYGFTSSSVIIIAITIGCILAVLLILVLVAWKCCQKTPTTSYDMYSGGAFATSTDSPRPLSETSGTSTHVNEMPDILFDLSKTDFPEPASTNL